MYCESMLYYVEQPKGEVSLFFVVTAKAFLERDERKM